MQDIFEQLKAEGQRCQPAFSQTLQNRCEEAIEQIERKNATPISVSRPTLLKRFQIWQTVAVAVAFCTGFVLFNSFLPSIDPGTGKIDEVASQSMDVEPIPINPITWEQLELESLAKSLDNSELTDTEEANGRSVGVLGTVKKMIKKPAPSKNLAAAIIRQDLSMGNLLVKAGSFAQVPEDCPEEIE